MSLLCSLHGPLTRGTLPNEQRCAACGITVTLRAETADSLAAHIAAEMREDAAEMRISPDADGNVSRRDLARLQRVKPGTVNQWVLDGAVPRGRHGKYNLEAVAMALAERRRR